MKEILTDKRYLGYYLFTAMVIATLLLVEDTLEGEHSWSWMFFDFITDIPIFTLITLAVSAIAYAVIMLLNNYFPWEQALLKRFMLEISLMVSLVVLLTMAASFLGKNYGLLPADADGDFGYETMVMIMLFITTFMQFSFHEFMMLSSDKQYLELRTGMLEKQNYLMKYEALKNQVNPHFLFNSLNVLSSLIYIDTDKSDRFIKKFSEVFRYVLELNQEKMVHLKQELKFLDSYFFLQKIRYGGNLTLHKSIQAETLEMFLPPLTLQLLIENAIKHNVIAKETPLCIEVASCGSELIVKNNYQFRSNLNKSTGIGHRNLIGKYQLIADQTPEFYIENGDYIAKLPLIENTEWKKF